MSFLESPRFPTDIALGATGGPGYQTEVIELTSGHEQRTSNWSYPRHSFDVSTGVRMLSQLEDLIAFFHVSAGRAHGFRFKDHADYKSCVVASTPARTDQTIGTGDSSDGDDGTAAWQLIKTYTSGSSSKVRAITKPVVDSVIVEVDGVLQTVTTHYTISHTTGIITFTAGNVPLVDEIIKAGYSFDIPSRFGIDKLPTQLDAYDKGEIGVPILEIKI